LGAGIGQDGVPDSAGILKVSYLLSYASLNDNFAIHSLSSLSLTFVAGISLDGIRLHQLSDAIDPHLNLNLSRSSMVHCDPATRVPNCGDAAFLSLSMTRRSPSPSSDSHRTGEC
jgi:hypothetical protein